MTEPAIVDHLPSRVALRNQALAWQAIRHVRRTLPLRDLAHPERDRTDVSFPAWLHGRFEQMWPVGHEAERNRQADRHVSSGTMAHRLAQLAHSHRAGAQATLAFAYLLSLGARPLDYMHLPGREHAFVLIGRDEPLHRYASTEADAARGELGPEDWGADTVVCDPYLGVVYRQIELIGTDYYYDYYPAESQLRAAVVPGAGFEG